MGLEGRTIIDYLIEKSSCCRKKPPYQRTVVINHKAPPGQDAYVPDQKFVSNEVKSSKYTAWNFIFKNLFEQFHRIANLYFLLMAIISGTIDSPVSPVISAIPLVGVVLVTAVKQGYEDWLRHKADKEVNNRDAWVIKEGKVVTIKAKDIRVGDIVKVLLNRGIPCDMVLLSSEHADRGLCYITTANLDGETNLKNYFCIPETKNYQTEEELEKLHGTIICEQPNTELYKFVGNLDLHSEGGSTEERPLSAENVLLRGSRLKNTAYVYGCAIFTGQDSKISMNSRVSTLKFSRIERRMNSFLWIFLAILVVYSTIWTGIKYWYYGLPEHSTNVMWYSLDEDPATAKHVVENFLAFMVLINYVIPISLYVTIEMQKIIGSKLFEWDAEMYDAETNEPAKANTSDLNEELGQVEYLFTDKTGTMTENKMDFRQCSIGGVRYEEVGGMLCVHPDIPGVQPSPITALTAEMEALFTVLVLCHTVRVDKKDNIATGGYSQNGFEYEYEASSPDEKALVEASRRYGIVFHGVKDDRLEVTFKGIMRRFIVQHVLDFDPTRKRMSVIVQNEDGSVYLLVKGADTAIYDCVIEGDIKTAEKHLEEFAKLGLRTLVIAHKKLTEEEFATFDNLLKKAKASLDSREEELSITYEAVEKNLTLLGITAVEDKLQDGVPETIAALREAGIQVWVVTGDKEETAVNISYAANHFSQDMVIQRITGHKDWHTCDQILKKTAKILEKPSEKYCLVIDGPSLEHALAANKSLLQHICQNVTTVLACRMSPLQKAKVVHLMKYSKGSPCIAAIGDGANDVSMIKEAHLGLGIMGKEGRQAVRASDYAFGRFRFLQRALLVHGHYYYVRLAVLVQYCFYKNVAMILSQLYFTFYSGFSAQSMFESVFLTFYNVTMTSLPILLYGLFEQHCKQHILLNNPHLYKTIQRNKRLSYLEFFKWCMLGVWHSVVFYFGTYLAIDSENSPNSDGQMFGIYEIGAIIFTACVFTTNIKLLLETYLFNWVTFLGFAITFLGYFVVVFATSEIWWPFLFENTFYKAFRVILKSPFVWLLVVLLVVAALLVDILLRAFTDNFNPLYRSQRTSRVGHQPDPDIMTQDGSSDSPVLLSYISNGVTVRATRPNSLSFMDLLGFPEGTIESGRM